MKFWGMSGPRELFRGETVKSLQECKKDYGLTEQYRLSYAQLRQWDRELDLEFKVDIRNKSLWTSVR